MGSYDNIVKTEEIRKKVEEGDFTSAQQILDTMELKKLKNISDLNLLAEVYKENERYDEAEGLYLKIYDKLKTRKTISQLVDIYIKKNDAKEAEEYLVQYQKLSPEDFDSLIFRYKIEKLQGASYEKLIDILEQLKRIEYTEQWAYELAKLYYKSGKEAECVKECTDIILWFGEGTYVEKARMLRSYYTGETDREKMLEKLKQKPTSSEEADTQASLVEEPQADEIRYDTDFMQEVGDDLEDGLSKDIQNLMSEEMPEEDDDAVSWEDYRQSDAEVGESVYDEAGTEGIREEAIPEESFATQEKEIEEEPVITQEEDIPEVDSQQEEELVPDEDDIKLRQLGDKYRLRPEEVFDKFLHVISIKKQLVKGLEIILKENKKSVFMIITGTQGSGKTTLAKDMALFLSKAGKVKSSKVAKISADKLNTVDIDSKRETLRSCCLVVENSSELKNSTIEKILELSKHLQGDFAVIFEEDKKNMNKLFRECPKLMDLLRVRIHLPQYAPEELFGFAVACINQKDYRLSPKAKGILTNKLDQIAKNSEPHRYLERINDLMQAVMNSADIRTGKKLSDLASQGRLGEFKTLEILPEDFKA